MRTIGFRSNVLFIVAAAVGLLASLGRPWYAISPGATTEAARIGEVNGPVETFFLRLVREFTTASGTSGWEAFSSTDTILAVLAAFSVVSAFGSLTRGLEEPSRELLRLTTFAMLGIVVVKLANTPEAAGLVERRQGAWIALGVTGIMASSATTLYSAPFARPKLKPNAGHAPLAPAPPRSHVFDSPAPTGTAEIERA